MRKYQILRRRDSGRVKACEILATAWGLELMRLAVEEERVAVTESGLAPLP